MSPISLRRNIALVGLLGWLALTGLGGGRGQGQPADGDRPALQPYYFAARQGCGRAGCHASPPTTEDVYLCRCDEYTRWSENDRHADATRALSGPRGRQMARLLGYDVTKAEACLHCHGVVIKDDAQRDKNFVAENEGVTCSVCHGAYKDWYEPHGSYLQAEKWRTLSRAEKERRFGMTDLWDPARRTALCTSCHIGNLDEGKFITHEMYAAGHPPLPSFEIATFCDAMPRHWQTPREKPVRFQKLLGFDGKEHDQTRLVLVGAAVSLRESLRLLARQSAACLKAEDTDERALDYAVFDCFACHHDLNSPSWRQRRGFAGAPGRVPLPSWPVALSGPLLRLTYGDEAPRQTEAVQRQRDLLEVALRVRPYGDPAKVEPAAMGLVRSADNLVSASRKTVDAASAARILAELRGPAPDYDSARQIAWALRMVYREQLLVNGKRPDPQAQRALASLVEPLRLTLPSGRKNDLMTDLGEALRARNAYDPDRFRQALTEVAGRLAAPQD
jgi:hypothetical protein